MADSAKTICSRAAQIAKVTSGMLPQAGQILNEVLQELSQTYDLAQNATGTFIDVDGSGSNNGTGPYRLPADYLRACSRDLFYYISGVPYQLTQITLAQFDSFMQVSGSGGYPKYYATDASSQTVVAYDGPVLYVHPAPTSLLSIQLRYYKQPADIVTPETADGEAPWFPNPTYLIRRVAGELMAITGDPRAEVYLGDGPSGCVGILRRYLNLQGDREDTIAQVQLDSRYFGPGGGFPPNKSTGGV